MQLVIIHKSSAVIKESKYHSFFNNVIVTASRTLYAQKCPAFVRTSVKAIFRSIMSNHEISTTMASSFKAEPRTIFDIADSMEQGRRRYNDARSHP